VVIAVGVDLVEYSPKNWNQDLDKKIIHIDFTPSEVYTYYRPIVEIVSDIESAINAILEELEQQKKMEPELDILPRKEIPEIFKKIIKEVDERRDFFKDDMSFPIKPEKLVIDVRNALGENDIVLSDVGAHKLWISKIYKTYQPNTCIIPNGFCSMGFAFPGAIAAKIVHPERNVVAMCGDAGFLMNVQEIETAVRLKLSVITIVWCDLDLGMISMKQKHEFGKSVFTKFTNPNFVTLAESFGAVGYVVKSTKEFSNILEEAKKIKDKPVIIAIDVDYSRNNVLLDDNHPDYLKSLRVDS
jgi:acetolactate synthase-1/2/3 large subunit